MSTKINIDMASLSRPDRAGSDLSRCVNHATSTAEGETPATQHQGRERHVELDQAAELPRVELRERPDPGEQRFVVVTSNAAAFDLWLFDKSEQSDEMHKVSIPFGPGVVHEIAARVVAWQLQGINLAELLA